MGCVQPQAQLEVFRCTYSEADVARFTRADRTNTEAKEDPPLTATDRASQKKYLAGAQKAAKRVHALRGEYFEEQQRNKMKRRKAGQTKQDAKG